MFQPNLRYVTLSSSWITEWQSKGLSNEILKVVSTTNNTLTPSVTFYRGKVRLRFTGSVLQQKALTYSHKKVVNIYVVYEMDYFQNENNYPILRNALFGAVKLTKNVDTCKYKYFDYGIGFDGRGFCSHSGGGTGR